MFDQRDKNKDLKLTRDEFLAGQKDSKGAPARFLRFDKDKNSTLSRDEFIEAGK
jgi:iduronate 2-sulfatase